MPRCRDGVSGWGHPPHVSPFVAIRLRVQSDLLLTGGRHSTLRFYRCAVVPIRAEVYGRVGATGILYFDIHLLGLLGIGRAARSASVDCSPPGVGGPKRRRPPSGTGGAGAEMSNTGFR